MPWQPGQSGNPKGRAKKGQTITDEIRKELKRRIIPDGDKFISRRKAIAKVLIELSIKGDLQAIKQLMTYIDGLPIEKHEITGGEGGPLRHQVIIDPLLIDEKYDDDDDVSR